MGKKIKPISHLVSYLIIINSYISFAHNLRFGWSQFHSDNIMDYKANMKCLDSWHFNISTVQVHVFN